MDFPCESPAAQRGGTRAERGIERVLHHIHQHFHEPLALTDLAEMAGLSVWRFATVFRQRVGTPAQRYIRNLRVQRAQALLREGRPTASAATEAGFYDQSHLSRHFKSVCGMTPGEYLSRVRGGRLQGRG